MNSHQAEYERGMKELALQCVEHANRSRKSWTMLACVGFVIFALLALQGIVMCATSLPFGLFLEVASGVILWAALDSWHNRTIFPRKFMENRQSIFDDIAEVRRRFRLK